MSMVSPLRLGLVLALAATACRTAPADPDPELPRSDATTTTPKAIDMSIDMNDADARNDTWTVTYSDHSGNAYRFWKGGADEDARFSYDPVSPESSSSGWYSGGEPREGTMSPAEVEALFQRIRDLEADIGRHAGSRMKGTGSFRVREGSGAERRFIVRAGSAREAFDALIERFRKP